MQKAARDLSSRRVPLVRVPLVLGSAAVWCRAYSVGVSVGLGRGGSQQILTLTLTDPKPDPKVIDVCVRRESLQVLGVLRAMRLVLGVLLDG